jgi:transcriptional regulator NrdR family protein
MSDLDQRLEAAVQKRKKLASDMERLRGRKEQAESNLAAIKEECLEKNINPEKIDDTLEKFTEKYAVLVQDIEKQTEEAEKSLAPYVGGNGTT